ncbi:protein-glutamate O-methyltransferase CheR [Desulfovibrio sp. JC010]|uniref:CheR family methyltransferase n=1 Tax=Desulfovibrio sp. JC010 TaxID=2593641 RepID=UPI0013D883BD|nr:protein-glutamate O-methyltransferase CheR [Desulfovibrio sp. JC010]NDV28708.1 tetratricopeptide repeat protein [Desulfovibrio sp. JC010]
MISSLTEDRIALLVNMVRERFGLDFGSDRWKDLRTAVLRFHKEDTGFNTATECLDYILSPAVKDKDLEQFINRLTIGETFFFRDSKALKVLEYEVLRKLSGMGSGVNGAIRIWSAACATGEEPYTLAMICRRAGVKSEIFGTDIDSRALIKAREGVYRKWSFRSEDTAFRDVFFRQVGANSYLLDPAIKNMVTLSRLNLIEAAVPAMFERMDVILCRNVLMYFSSKGVDGVLDKLWDCMNTGGWLIATPSESALLTTHGRFEPVNLDGCLFYRKNEQWEPRRAELFVDTVMPEESVFPAAFSDSDVSFVNKQQEESYTAADILAAEDIYMAGDAEPLTEGPVSEAGTDGAGLLDEARGLRSQGELSGAVDMYKTILGQDHGRDVCAAASLGIARIKADSGLADEAAVWCRRAIELDRVDPGAHFLLGQISLQQGDRDKALAEMRNAVFLDSGFIMAHVLLGNIYQENSDKNGAMRHFRIALQELGKAEQDEAVPFSDGTTAGRLLEMVRLVQDNLV